MLTALQHYTKEFRYNIQLAYPVVIGLLGHTLVQLVDNIMVGQLGTTELAAVSLGNSFVFVAMSLGIGFSIAITPLVAEADGAQNILQSRKLFLHGLLLCSSLGVFMVMAVTLCRPLLYAMGQPEAVVVLAFPYLKWAALSLFPLITFQGFKQFSEGLSHTRPGMYATLFANFMNVVLNYFLIFGIWIFPKMGVEGAAIGTLASRFGMLIFMGCYLRLDARFSVYVRNLKFQMPSFTLFKKIIQLGFPSALQMFFEVVFFTIAIWLSGFLGKNPQAANQIALNLSSMTYMFALGFGAVAMIRVGNQKGKQNFRELRRVAYSIFILIILIDIFFCIFFIASNRYLPWIYLNADQSIYDSDILTVVGLASKLLLVSGFFQIFDGMQAVVLGALRGVQDVNIPALFTFVAYGIIGLPVCYVLGLHTSLGVVGIWIGLLSGLAASCILLFLRFQYLIKKLIFLNRTHGAT